MLYQYLVLADKNLKIGVGITQTTFTFTNAITYNTGAIGIGARSTGLTPYDGVISALYYFEGDISANLRNLVNYYPNASLETGKIHTLRDWVLPLDKVQSLDKLKVD